MNESLARQALEKIQKQATIIDELRVRCARLEALVDAAGVSKSAQRKAATESLGTTATLVLKAASAPKREGSRSWTPTGALKRLEKSATANATEPKPGDTVSAAVHKALRGAK